MTPTSRLKVGIFSLIISNPCNFVLPWRDETMLLYEWSHVYWKQYCFLILTVIFCIDKVTLVYDM